MRVTLLGGHTIDADPGVPLRLPVLERRAEGGAPDLGESAVCVRRGRRGSGGERESGQLRVPCRTPTSDYRCLMT